MRYAIISDIHSNQEAFERILSALEIENIEKFICLGDLVGYGANPNECVERVKELTDLVIAGNHDYASCGLTDTKYFNPVAKQAIFWTESVLKEEYREYVKNLGLTLKIKDTFFVHSSPSEPAEWQYIFSLDDAIFEFRYFEEKICFIGHSHIAFAIKEKQGRYSAIEGEEFTIDTNAKYIVNVGSVGQPRDLDPRASCVVFDNERKSVKFIRSEYDIEKAQKKILDAGLPHFLAERLKYGR